MNHGTARRLATVTFAVVCAGYVFDAVVPLVALAASGQGWSWDVRWDGLVLVAITFTFPLVGYLVARQQPRNAVAWIMLAVGILVAGTGNPYETYGLVLRPGSLPGADVVAALTATTWAPILGLVGTFLILLFPDGHLPSPRWRWVAWFSGFAIAWVYVSITLSPGPLGDVAPNVENPLGIAFVGDHTDALLPTILVLPISFLLCAAGVVQRYRRSTGVERVQLKWLATAGAVVAATYLIAMVCSLVADGRWENDPPWLSFVQNIAVFSFGLIPVAIGIAILRHGLYEIDVVINRSVVFATLAVFITGVYVAIVVGVGSLVGRGDEPNLALSITATAVVAAAFEPVRDRVQRVANRLVYGERAEPYEVLADFADRMGSGYDATELLPVMARTVREGAGAASAEVWLASGTGLVREASWPRASGPARVGHLADLIADRVIPVRHHDELLGALVVALPAGESLPPVADKLLTDVAAQAGLVLRNVRLIEELRSSQQRLVTAQDEERRRLERKLREGAQRRLTTVALTIRTARARLADDAGAEALDQVAVQLQAATDELRELARGISPALLTERGLRPAIVSLAERAAVPVTVDLRLDRRLSPTVEATLYFVVAEALTNVAKYAQADSVTVRLVDSGDRVVLEVVDDGVGGADAARGSGLRGLTDRVAAVGGRFTVESPVPGGTRLTCAIPVPAQPGGATPDKSDVPPARRPVTDLREPQRSGVMR